MKRRLTKAPRSLFHFIDDTKKEGPHSALRGDCTGLWGNCSALRGDCSALRGNCTGLWGHCTGLWGDLDDCELTDADRTAGVDVSSLCETMPNPPASAAGDSPSDA